TTIAVEGPGVSVSTAATPRKTRSPCTPPILAEKLPAMGVAPTRVPPGSDEVRVIAAIESPVIRNLEITECYSRLAAAVAARSGEGANWCTYATWASRQAGHAIRGEDMLDGLHRNLAGSRWLPPPFGPRWRRLLRRALFDPAPRLGRLTAGLHTPFDAFERASDAVARGNLKVFAEIGLEFARFLEECPADSTDLSAVHVFVE